MKPWAQVSIAGITSGLAFFPLNLGFLAWVSFVPLLNVFINSSLYKNLIYGYIFGFTFNFTAFYWIGLNSGADKFTVIGSLVAAACYLSVFWALAGFLFSLLPRDHKSSFGGFLFPFLIVFVEWLRSFGVMGFPWSNIALSQSKYIYFIQHIDITGTYGVSFIVISFNVIVYNAIKKRIALKNALFFILFVFLGLSLTGWSKVKSLSSFDKIIKTAIVQPNIDPNTKWENKNKIIAMMDSLHVESNKLNPDLIIFPETALPSYLVRDNYTRRILQKTVNRFNVPLLTGTIHASNYKGSRYYYNSAIFLKPHSDYKLYSKIHLVPFAEYDLLPAIFHPLTKLNINIDRGRFKSGEKFVVFNWKNFSFSNLICYESSIPRIARKFVSKGAQFLVIQANDGWLGNSYGPYQHFELARLRAIENRIPVIRCANTGISGIIRPDGTVQNIIDLNQEGIMIENVKIGVSDSFYTKHGDIFAFSCFIITLVFIFYSCIKRFF